MLSKSFLSEFKSPSSQFRGKPFWAWNGKLEPNELRRQIRIMKRMGLGGFFMHSRVGLDTPYLEKEWFDAIDACVDEAKKQDMEAWLYDEDRWPSGAAGGIVTKNKKFRRRTLKTENHIVLKSFSWKPDIVAAFCLNLSGTIVSNMRRLKKNERPKVLEAGQSILSFVKCIDEEEDWYNGQTYLDTMNPAAVAAYIKSTHEAYRKRYRARFGKEIPGIFTDEPNFGVTLKGSSWNDENAQALPWTDKLPEVFEKRYGYDVLDHLPELIYDIEGQPVSQARYHYHDCRTFLFVDSFARQIGEWCEKNKLQFTGHVLEEDTPQNQTNVVGSAMRFYEYMQAPGIDMLTERWRSYETAKQVSSMARQFGWKWRLTETYGCTGWDFSFAGQKAVGDWQAALGINLRCQHLAWYTMLGEAKRDYPAGIFYQSPWWELYPKVEDYFARIHAAMTQGTEVRDLLVIHPIESTWLHCKDGWRDNARVRELNTQLVELRDSLLCEHIDFDYGEEEVMSRHGRVRAGKSGPEFCINKAKYTAVLVPELETIRSTTLRLLKKFKQAGGLVVFAGKAPAFVDAIASDEATRFSAECVSAPRKGPALAAAVSTTRRIRITDDKGKEIAPALYLLREDADAWYLFICNTSLSQEQMTPNTFDEVLVRERKEAFPRVAVIGFAECLGAPMELDPDTGALYTALATKESDGWNIATSLPALGSRIFIVPKKPDNQPFGIRKNLETIRTETLQQKQWPVQLSDCGNLVLDRPSYKIGTKIQGEAEEILRLDKKVRDALKISHRGGQMVQPWAQKKPAQPRSIPVELTYDFFAETLPGGDLYLALERPDVFTIFVNGTRINTDVECGWWVDVSLRKVPLDPGLLRLGKNQMTLKLNYEETFSGLEIVYLLGNFGTKVHGTTVSIIAPVTSLDIGDWTTQGLAFYSGSVSYCTTLARTPSADERTVIAVPEFRGTAVRVIVNGIMAGLVAWEPNTVDITDFLTQESNEVRIEVVGHRRNSHGPHHLREKWPAWTGPAQYTAEGDDWFEGYNLVPCGLMQAPEVRKCRKK